MRNGNSETQPQANTMDLPVTVLTSKPPLIVPGLEDWETVRPLITKLWYEHDASISTVLTHLRDQYSMKASSVLSASTL